VEPPRSEAAIAVWRATGIAPVMSREAGKSSLAGLSRNSGFWLLKRHRNSRCAFNLGCGHNRLTKDAQSKPKHSNQDIA